MVKVNGQRVEPGEVEATICGIEGISRAVVKGFLNPSSGSQYLVGYYTVKSEEIKVKSEVYNLKGQRVSEPTKGLYIVNGKKIAIK